LLRSLGEIAWFKEIVPNSPKGEAQFLQLASLLKAQHFEKLFYTNLMWFKMDHFWCPRRELNPQP
jgi:hypothetical protein